jgi:hypothetical protein
MPPPGAYGTGFWPCSSPGRRCGTRTRALSPPFPARVPKAAQGLRAPEGPRPLIRRSGTTRRRPRWQRATVGARSNAGPRFLCMQTITPHPSPPCGDRAKRGGGGCHAGARPPPRLRGGGPREAGWRGNDAAIAAGATTCAPAPPSGLRPATSPPGGEDHAPPRSSPPRGEGDRAKRGGGNGAAIAAGTSTCAPAPPSGLRPATSPRGGEDHAPPRSSPPRGEGDRAKRGGGGMTLP